MRRLLGLLLPLGLLVAACGDGGDEAAEPTTTVADADDTIPAAEEPAGEDDGDDEAGERPDAETTVPVDAPAGDAPDGAGADEGLGDVLLVADLRPGSVVPGPGEDGAEGRFEAELVDGVLCVDMVVSGRGGAVTGAHLHEGGPEVEGPVVVDLGGPSEATAGQAWWTDACTEVADDVIERLAGDPGGHHVQVHTGARPAGAVRGQVEVASVFDRTLG